MCRDEVVQLPLRTMCSPLEVMIDAGDLPVERPGAYDIRNFLLRDEQMRIPTHRPAQAGLVRGAD